ncbi:MAG: hypothetical protein HZA23_02105 [Nitrospirae bacterium]|nr:hypothetical protein [Nitrospirota bacterium]
MGGVAGRLLASAGIVVAAAVAVLLSFLPWLAERTTAIPSADALSLAATYDPWQARYPYLTGRMWEFDLDRHDPQAAFGAYARTLQLNPLDGLAWLDLARTAEETGRDEIAARALSNALRVSPRDPAVHWEVASARLRRGEAVEGLETFQRYLRLLPDQQDRVYAFAWALSGDAAFFLQHLVPDRPDYLTRALRFFIGRGLREEARLAWDRLRAQPSPVAKQDALDYLAFLLSQRRWSEGREVWSDLLRALKIPESSDSAEAVWNGSFELPLLKGGFDWRFDALAGTQTRIDEDYKRVGSRALRLRFDGKQNYDFHHVSQPVLLRPGTVYRLKGYLRTDGLTTSNGLFLEVTGFGCEGLRAATPAATGTQFWSEVKTEFLVPAGCEAGILRLRREPSRKIDNRFGGTAWVDGVSLRPASAASGG